MLKSEIPKPKPSWFTRLFDWTIFWLIENLGTKQKYKGQVHQERKKPPWAQKACKTRRPMRFQAKPRTY